MHAINKTKTDTVKVNILINFILREGQRTKDRLFTFQKPEITKRAPYIFHVEGSPMARTDLWEREADWSQKHLRGAHGALYRSPIRRSVENFDFWPKPLHEFVENVAVNKLWWTILPISRQMSAKLWLDMRLGRSGFDKQGPSFQVL